MTPAYWPNVEAEKATNSERATERLVRDGIWFVRPKSLRTFPNGMNLRFRPVVEPIMTDELPAIPPVPANAAQGVHPKADTPESIPLAPPELRGTIRARLPWMALAAILGAIGLAVYWLARS